VRFVTPERNRLLREPKLRASIRRAPIHSIMRATQMPLPQLLVAAVITAEIVYHYASGETLLRVMFHIRHRNCFSSCDEAAM
jgi:hypothetical protein